MAYTYWSPRDGQIMRDNIHLSLRMLAVRLRRTVEQMRNKLNSIGLPDKRKAVKR